MGQTYSPASRRVPKQRRSRDLVRAILDATAKVLVEEGYDRASTNRIAKVAGVSVGSLYQYFPNKQALVMALAAEHADEQIGALAAALRTLGDAPVHVAVATFVQAMIDAHRQEPELHVAMVQQVLHVGLKPMIAIQGRARDMVRTWLVVHRDQILPTDLDAASYLLVTTVEAVIHSAILDDPRRLDDPSLQRELVAMLLRYLGCEAEI